MNIFKEFPKGTKNPMQWLGFWTLCWYGYFLIWPTETTGIHYFDKQLERLTRQSQMHVSTLHLSISDEIKQHECLLTAYKHVLTITGRWVFWPCPLQAESSLDFPNSLIILCTLEGKMSKVLAATHYWMLSESVHKSFILFLTKKARLKACGVNKVKH